MRWLPQSSALLFALFLVAAGSAHAQEGNPALQGTYTLDVSASDDINKAIDHTVTRMNALKRPIARSRLQKVNQPYRRVVIAHSGSEVSITTDDRAPIVTSPDGTPIQWRREDGEQFDVSTRWKDGKLEQTFKAEDGQRVNTYTISPDGKQLTLEAWVTSSRLPRPLSYTLVYNKQ